MLIAAVGPGPLVGAVDLGAPFLVDIPLEGLWQVGVPHPVVAFRYHKHRPCTCVCALHVRVAPCLVDAPLVGLWQVGVLCVVCTLGMQRLMRAGYIPPAPMHTHTHASVHPLLALTPPGPPCVGPRGAAATQRHVP